MKKGTWAWACQMILEGKTVGRGDNDGYQLKNERGFIKENMGSAAAPWTDIAHLESVDLAATDWRIIE